MTRTLGGLCRSEKRRTIAASCVPAQSTERLHDRTPRLGRHRRAGARLIQHVRQEAAMRCRRTCPRRGTSLAGHHTHSPSVRPAAFTPRSRDGHGLHEPNGRPGNSFALTQGNWPDGEPTDAQSAGARGADQPLAIRLPCVSAEAI